MSENGIDGFKGAVFTSDDAGYDEARTIFNAMIDRRPAVIAQCADAADVAAAIRFGREQRPARSRCAAAGTASPAWPSTDGGLVDRPAPDERRDGRPRRADGHGSAAAPR